MDFLVRDNKPLLIIGSSLVLDLELFIISLSLVNSLILSKIIILLSWLLLISKESRDVSIPRILSFNISILE